MDKWQALHDFWSGFGIPAYDETDIPDDAVMPYITYTASVSPFESYDLLTASVWYRSTSWEAISKKVEEISKAITPYKLQRVDSNQYIHLTRGSPFAQRMADLDLSVRRVYINVTAEFFTFN